MLARNYISLNNLLKNMEEAQNRGSSNFSANEFETQGKNPQNLREAIKQSGYKLETMSDSENAIDWLNAILKLTDLYKEII